MEAKAFSFNPPYQGVCRLHGMEEQCVTPGELVQFSGGTEIRKPISKAKWQSKLYKQSDDRIVLQAQ